MADINDINAAQTTKIVGADTDGTEQTPVRSSTQGSIQTIEVDDNGRKGFNYSSGEKGVAARILSANTSTIMDVTTDNAAFVKVDPRPLRNVIYRTTNLLNGTSKNMSVNGSGTPVNFQFVPTGSDIWFLESVGLFFIDPGTMDYNDFAGISGSLTNGLKLVIRSNGVEYEICNVVDNAQVVAFFNQYTSLGKSSSGIIDEDDSYTGHMKFDVPIKLNAATGDYVRFQVRDSFTSITGIESYAKLWRQI